jgi:hypothetical protein
MSAFKFGAKAVKYDERDDECEGKYREDPVDDIPVETQNISSIDDYENYRINNVEISEVIDLEVWNSLDGETRNKVEANALSNLRPQGIEKYYWDILEGSVKANIIDSLKRNNVIDVKLGSPEKIVGQSYATRPRGFDPELGESMKSIRHVQKSPVCLPAWFVEEVVPTNNRSKRWYLKWWLQRITYKSRVVNFFIPGNHHVIEEPDGGMSAMALVCALILTIPFGVFSHLNDEFFSSVREAIEVSQVYIKIYSYD